MMYPNEALKWTQNNTNSAMCSLRRAAGYIDDLARDLPEYFDVLQELSSQLWTMEDLTRHVEHGLADISTTLRKG